MSDTKRRKITIGLFGGAVLIAGIALALAAAGKQQAVAAKHLAQRPEGPVGWVVETQDEGPPAPKVEPQPPAPPAPPRRPEVDVVFVLDTTGSMAGLIEGAKRKIWDIANQVLQGQPQPHVRIGLVGYRDIGDAYVTRRYALTENIDDVHRRLRGFSAAGGGDTPEHVNKALADAIRTMQWREGQNVLRQIYLVGDAPPHEGRSGLYSHRLAREAVERGILINAVRCGSQTDTAVAWQRVARAAGGLYASIGQDGGLYAVATPMDRRLAELNKELSGTLLIAGGARERREAGARAAANAALGEGGMAASATFRARSGHLDSADLVAQVKGGKDLSAFKPSDLPAPVAALPPAKRPAYVAEVATRRSQLQEEIRVLAAKRDAYVRAKRSKPGRAAGFDDTVGEALKVQGRAAGLAY